MALRDRRTGEVLSFRACAINLRHGQLTPIGLLLDGMCPTHNSTDCVETYVSGRRLASWSLRDFLSYRRARRARNARAEAHR